MLDLRVQLSGLGDDMKRALTDVLESTQYILGPRVAELPAASLAAVVP